MDSIQKLAYDYLKGVTHGNKFWKRLTFSSAEKLFDALVENGDLKVFGRNPNGSVYGIKLPNQNRPKERIVYALRKWYESRNPDVPTEDPPAEYILGEENQKRNPYNEAEPIKP